MGVLGTTAPGEEPFGVSDRIRNITGRTEECSAPDRPAFITEGAYRTHDVLGLSGAVLRFKG